MDMKDYLNAMKLSVIWDSGYEPLDYMEFQFFPTIELKEKIRSTNRATLNLQWDNFPQTAHWHKTKLLNDAIWKRATLLTECPIDGAIVDAIWINNDSMLAIEIKSKYDNMKLLEKEINAYYKIFTHVVVLCCEENLAKVRKAINHPATGIYLATRDGIEIARESVEFADKLDANALWHFLLKKEKEIVRKGYGLPLDKTPRWEETYKKPPKGFDHSTITTPLADLLRKRNQMDYDFLQSLPCLLRYIAFKNKLTNEKKDVMLKWLDK